MTIHGPRRFDDRLRVILIAFAVIVTVIVPPWWPYCFLLGALLIAALASGVSLCTWLKRSAAVTPFLLLVGMLVPFSGQGKPILVVWERLGWMVTEAGIEKWALITVRGLLAVGWLALLAVTTTPERIVAAFTHLRVPRVVVGIAWLTYRYLWVLLDEGRTIIRAWTCRRIYPRRRDDVLALAQIVGVLFVRAVERAERVHLAMRARGFTGTPPAPAVPPMSRLDVIATVSAVCAGAALVLIAS